MDTPDSSLIGPEDTAYRLELTPAELKVTYTALRGAAERLRPRRVRRPAHRRASVIDKLPPAESIESIDLRLPRGRPRL